ncbi:MAG TPA: kinase/pyrophosphorylase [Rhodospirillales bacterium]|nr:kinase/pyrophosphorylase [Rhodospirillales bacterium]
MKSFNLHLVSDSTGETVITVARACLVQFDDVKPKEFIWRMVRNRAQVDDIIEGVKKNPGFVLYTLVNEETRDALEEGCRPLKAPCVPLLEPVIGAMGSYLGAEVHARPGRQHVMDAEYFRRIEAMHFVLSHDDGQSTWDMDKGDVLILGVSRTSKTPTCIYLANRGIKAANIPIVPGVPFTVDVEKIKHLLVVGLTSDPKLLVQIRRNRLKMLNQDERTDYVDFETVTQEVNDARRLFTKNNWPIIDVTRKSIEEVSATILQLYNRLRVEQT